MKEACPYRKEGVWLGVPETYADPAPLGGSGQDSALHGASVSNLSNGEKNTDLLDGSKGSVI